MVTWDSPVTGKDSVGNTLTLQKCNNWDWGNPNSCNDQKPSGTAKWSTCTIGSSPGGIAPGDSAILCSPLSDTFNCKWGQNCFAVTSFVPADVTWRGPVSGKDSVGNKITIQKCDDWVNADPNSCNTSPTKPSNTIKWSKCAIGSSPGGIQPGHSALLCSPLSDTFNCVGGQNCFAVTSFVPADVTWRSPVSGCDGTGNKITIQKCDDWVNRDPNSCNNSPTKPSRTKKWINCGLGSSPGGIYPGEGARACSPISDNFDCLWGQNCYAITDFKEDVSCPKDFLSDPLKATSSLLDKYKIIFIVIAIVLLIFSTLGVVFSI